MGFGRGRRRQTKPRSRVIGSMAKAKNETMKSAQSAPSRPRKKPSASASVSSALGRGPRAKAKSKHTPRKKTSPKSKSKSEPKRSKPKTSQSKRKAEKTFALAPECPDGPESATVALETLPKVALENKKRHELSKEFSGLAKALQRRPVALRRPAAHGEELERMRIESERKAEQDMLGKESLFECNSEKAIEGDGDGGSSHQEKEGSSSSPSTDGSGSDSDDLSPASGVSSSGVAATVEGTGGDTAAAAAASALNMKDVEENDGVWTRPHQGESQAAAATTCPDGTEALAGAESQSDVKVPEDMLLTADRMVGKLRRHYGIQAVHNLFNNLNKSTLVTLYSGLGGAELAFEQAHLACVASLFQHDNQAEPEQTQQPQTQARPRPNYLLACENDPECIRVLETHEAKPKVVPNILSFVQQWAVNKMDSIVNRLNQDVDKVMKKAKNKASRKKTKNSKSKSKNAAEAENEQEADPDMKKQVRKLGLEALREIVGVLDKREAFKEKIVDVNGRTVTLSQLLELAEHLVMWCGSVCKDWSPMSSQNGFSGKWMPLFGVMIGLVRLLKPRCFFHENSSKFDSSVFRELLGDLGFSLHHEILDPRDFGMPVRRPRAWDCILRKDVGLMKELYDLQKFKSPVVLDAGAFALASDKEVEAVKRRMAMTAMQGISEPFSNLLPPGALSNLTKYRALAADLLGCHKEVACNLDQNPDCMPHWGCQMPVVLASTTNMWLLKQNRPLTAKELLASQGVPIFERLWRLAGFADPPLNVDRVRESAVRRMAGNSFNQAVAISFLMFIMANLRPAVPPDSPEEPAAPVAAG